MTPRHSVAVTAQPVSEPVSLAQAKAQCNVEHTAADLLFAGGTDGDGNVYAGWIKAARQMVEEASGRKLLTQTVRVTFAGFPCDGGPLELPVWPVQSVTAVSYKRSEDGAETALAGVQAWLDHTPPLLAPPAADGYWPAVDDRYLSPVTVTVQAGAAAVGDVPGYAKQAILLILGYWWGFRGDGRDPAAMEALPGEVGLPAGVIRLLDLMTPKRYG